jgi:MFS family permease
MELTSEQFVKPFEPATDKHALLTLLACLTTSQMTYLNIAAMVPTHVDQNFPGVSAFQIGILFAFYPVMYLLICPFVGLYMARLGRKKCLVTGMMLMTASTFVFGIAAWSSNVWIYFGISAIARSL